MFKTIAFHQEGEVAVVTLNRPKRLNALSVELLEELSGTMREVEGREELKAVVITGGEKVFCAGADITMFPGLSTPEKAYEFVQFVKYSLGSIRRLSKPVVAAICGYALGGGMELSLYCDLRIAADDAKLGLPEIDLAAFPAAGGTQLLPRLIGPALANEMLLVGEPISGREAYRIGLVNKICPKEEVLAEAMKMAGVLAKKPAYAVRTIKRIVYEGLEMDLARACAYESSSFVGIWASHDFKEGYSSFLEKRRPDFQGK